MATRLTDVIKSVWNGRTTTPVADLVALLQTVAWNFAAGLNVTGTVAVTGNETVSGTLGVTGTSTVGIINASGKLTVSAGGVAITGGLAADTLILASGTALANYVEGTFTPVIQGATLAGVGTYSIQNGYYTRVGNRCLFTLTVVWSAHTGTGSMLIAGLPFAVNAAANGYSSASLRSGTAAIPSSDQILLQPGSSQITMETNAFAGQAMTASGSLIIAGQYRI